MDNSNSDEPEITTGDSSEAESSTAESSSAESNPEVEALQAELNHFRKSGVKLSGDDLEEVLQGLVSKARDGEKVVLAFLGIPGGGKSKLIEKVARAFKLETFHVRRLVSLKPELKKIENEFYRKGEILPAIEKDFLELIFKNKAQQILIDGFPRTLFQAVALYEYAVKNNYRVVIVETKLLKSREVFQSFYRQINRAEFRIKKGLLFGQAEEEEYERIIHKIKRALELDLYVIETLRLLDAEMISLDSTKGPSKMLAEFKTKFEP